jgi:TolB protein
MHRVITFVSFLCLAYGNLAQGGIYLTVTGAGVKRAKIAVGQIHQLPDGSAFDPVLAKKVRDQLRSDLEFENVFDFQNEATFAAMDQAKDLYNINYDTWTLLQVAFLLKLAYKLTGNKLVLEASFYDVPGKKKIFGTRYQYPSAQFPRLVHAVAEDILKETTGERGLFFSRILMVCTDLKRRHNPPKEVYIADADGRNMLQLTSDETLSLSPAWSPDGRHITYTQYEWRISGGQRKKGTVLKIHDLQTGQRRVLSAKEGMNSGAAWSPDGKKIALTLSFTGRPEIYLLDPQNPSAPEPLSRYIQWKKVGGDGFQQNSVQLLFDVEPNWSPDGKKLVISSARTGHPMIYTVDVATKIANQLTFAGIYNASPAWSPKGDKIMFAAQQLMDGNFDLYIIDPDGNNMGRITRGESLGRHRSNSENPSWAPTGRHIAYSSNESGNTQILIMTSDGAIRHRISPSDKACETPAWGPPEG